MRKGNRQTISHAMQVLGMLTGLIVAPVATPALIWATLTADVPLALVILQLFIIAVISNLLLHIVIRIYNLVRDGSDDQTIGNPWSAWPRSG